MESSTVTFFALLAGLFILVSYFNSPKPQPTKTVKKVKTSAQTAAPKTSAPVRPINQSMIEIVQQIAPNLTEEQIVYDYSKSGSIEATIDNYLKNGNLPFPPNTQKPKGWASTKEERTANLEKKRQEMIQNARLRLKKQLANEIDI